MYPKQKTVAKFLAKKVNHIKFIKHKKGSVQMNNMIILLFEYYLTFNLLTTTLITEIKENRQ